MNGVWKVFLSMSCSGGLLILALLLGKRFWRDRVSRQWQYYIWLAAVLRLLLPFGPEVSLLGRTYQAVDRAVAQAAPLPSQRPAVNTPEEVPAPAADIERGDGNGGGPAGEAAPAAPARELWTELVQHIWLVWLAGALGLLIRKITVYQSFTRYLRSAAVPVSDRELLDRLAGAMERAGVRGPVELCVCPLVSSPLLAGFFHPCIVLPSGELSERDLRYTLLHELIHYKRRDIFYKWLVQVTVCLHWFDPLVYLMEREIARACEFSCDEAVLARMGSGCARDYGETLLNAMAAVGKHGEYPGAVTLSENKQVLKERLGAIMNFQRKSAAVRLLTGALTLCVILGAAFVGVYPAAAAFGWPSGKPPVYGGQNAAQAGTGAQEGVDCASRAERYYAADSLPLFEITFPRLDESTQKAWLTRLYAEGDAAFFSVAVRGLGAESPLPAAFAEKAYDDGETALFSTLADRMDEAELGRWLDRALEDGKWAFQSMLFDRLDKSGGFEDRKDEGEKEWEAAQAAAYGAVGVTMDGKRYYYQGQLVNIFLDIRADNSFYTLSMDPAGTVNVRILRDAENKITGAVRMTGAEVTALLEDMSDDEDRRESAGGEVWHPRVIPVNYETVAKGEIIWLGEYTISEGDRIQYDVFAKTGEGLQVGFVKPGDTDLNTVYYSVKNLRQRGEALECTAAFTVKPPVEPGTYRLFLWAVDGALENVRGGVSIGYAVK